MRSSSQKNPLTSARFPRRLMLTSCLVALTLAGSGCAYFNTFYHAKKYYAQAQDLEKKSRELPTGAQAAAATTINVNRNDQPQNARAADLYKKTVDKCQKVIEKYPGSKWQDDAHLLLAKAYFGRRDFLSARKELAKFDERFPESGLLPEALRWLGLTAFAQEDYAEARDTWSRLVERFPRFDERESVDFHLALSYWKEERVAEAEEAFNLYLANHSKGEFASQARLELGRLLLEERRYQEAEKVFTRVSEKGKKEVDRLEAQLMLGEVLERQGRYDDALSLYSRAALTLDPEVYKGRMTPAEREEKRLTELAEAAARQDSLLNAGGTSLPAQNAAARNIPNPQQKRRNPENLRDKQVAQVMLREGVVMSRLNRAWDAILAYEQIIAEFPRTPYAAEAQYRIGYVHEVLLEDLDGAQEAYDKVPFQGRSSFTEDAQRRSKNLNTVKDLLASAEGDSLSHTESAAAEARFMRAELYLFQQEKPERAMEEYDAIGDEFPGSEFAAKAALAKAWVVTYALRDTAQGMGMYAQVAQVYPDTEYGRRASRMVYGPEPEPLAAEFAGPALAELLHPENLAAIAAAKSEPTPPSVPPIPATGVPQRPPGGVPAGAVSPPGNLMAVDPDSAAVVRPTQNQIPLKPTPVPVEMVANKEITADSLSVPVPLPEPPVRPAATSTTTLPTTPTPVTKPVTQPPAEPSPAVDKPVEPAQPATPKVEAITPPPKPKVEPVTPPPTPKVEPAQPATPKAEPATPKPIAKDDPPVLTVEPAQPATPKAEPATPKPIAKDDPPVLTVEPAQPATPKAEPATPKPIAKDDPPVLTVRPVTEKPGDMARNESVPATKPIRPTVRVGSGGAGSKPIDVDTNPERLPPGPLGGKLNPWAVPEGGPTPVLSKKSFRSTRVTGKNKPSSLQNQRTGKGSKPN